MAIRLLDFLQFFPTVFVEEHLKTFVCLRALQPLSYFTSNPGLNLLLFIKNLLIALLSFIFLWSLTWRVPLPMSLPTPGSLTFEFVYLPVCLTPVRSPPVSVPEQFANLPVRLTSTQVLRVCFPLNKGPIEAQTSPGPLFSLLGDLFYCC